MRYRLRIGSEIIYPESSKKVIYTMSQDGQIYRLDRTPKIGLFTVTILQRGTYSIEYSTEHTDKKGKEVYVGDTLKGSFGNTYHVIDLESFHKDLEQDPNFLDKLEKEE